MYASRVKTWKTSRVISPFAGQTVLTYFFSRDNPQATPATQGGYYTGKQNTSLGGLKCRKCLQSPPLGCYPRSPVDPQTERLSLTFVFPAKLTSTHPLWHSSKPLLRFFLSHNFLGKLVVLESRLGARFSSSR